MPYRIGLLAYPGFLVALVLARSSGAANMFLKAGAGSPTTGRQLASVGVEHRETMDAAVKRGLLASMRDRRYYVNMTRLRTSRRLTIAALSGVTVMFLVFAVLLRHPWL